MTKDEQGYIDGARTLKLQIVQYLSNNKIKFDLIIIIRVNITQLLLVATNLLLVLLNRILQISNGVFVGVYLFFVVLRFLFFQLPQLGSFLLGGWSKRWGKELNLIGIGEGEHGTND